MSAALLSMAVTLIRPVFHLNLHFFQHVPLYTVQSATIRYSASTVVRSTCFSDGNAMKNPYLYECETYRYTKRTDLVR